MKIYAHSSNLSQKTFHSNAFHHIFLVFMYHSMKKVIIISKCINLGLIIINLEEFILCLSFLRIIISF